MEIQSNTKIVSCLEINNGSPATIQKGDKFTRTMQNKEILSLGTDLYSELVKFGDSVRAGKEFSPKELLNFQFKASQFGLRLEILSKLGESLSSTIKKLEQGH